MEESKIMKIYSVWKPSIRVFHWINFMCVMGLIGLGLIILYSKNLGVNTDGKVLLKTLHAYLGYIFVINLIGRIIYFFSNDSYSNWKAIFSFGKKDLKALKLFIKTLNEGNTPNYLGHNPIAKLMISFLFLLLMMQAISGLVLAGTDLYLPPFGDEIAKWVTGEDPNKLATLQPGSKKNLDMNAYNEMRIFRKPFITVHIYVFYSLLIAIFLHIVGVILSEIREKSGVISSMITGDKLFSKKPLDYDNDE